jgi:hypothetical protein
MRFWIVFARKSRRGHQRFTDHQMNNPFARDEGVTATAVEDS